MQTRSVLVVDDSEFSLTILKEVLQPLFSAIRVACSYRDAIQNLERNPDTEVVLCDAVLPDGNGFQLLEHLADPAPPSPKVILISSQWSEADRERAMNLGAVGCLQRPISIQEIRTCLAITLPHEPRDPRHRTLARVWLIHPTRRERMLSLWVHNISSTGALLDSIWPLPVGTELELEIAGYFDDLIRVRATVVRRQEPSKLNPGGTAVHFDWVESPGKLCRLIGSHDPRDS